MFGQVHFRRWVGVCDPTGSDMLDWFYLSDVTYRPSAGTGKYRGGGVDPYWGTAACRYGTAHLYYTHCAGPKPTLADVEAHYALVAEGVAEGHDPSAGDAYIPRLPAPILNPPC